MKNIKRFIAILLCIQLCASLTQAQPASDERRDAQTTNAIAQDALIIIQKEQVRFTTRSSVIEMRLQVFDQAGQLVYDSGVLTGPELNWPLRDAYNNAVKSGMYAYQLSIKEAGEETARVRRGHFIVDRARERDGKTDRLWVTSQNESGVGTELTVARSEGETIAGTSVTREQKSMTDERVTARDGETEAKNEINAAEAPAAASGTIGRIAKFTSSTDLGDSVITELNGAIGIGTATPATKLEVAGNWTGVDGALRVSGDKPTIRFTGGAITGNQSWILHQGSEGPGNLQFFNKAGANAWKNIMSLGSNGKVGIGTNATTHQLEIVGQFGLAIVGYQPFLTLSDSNAGWAQARIQNVNGGLNFQTHDLTSIGGSAMYIQNGTRNIGIGTSTPQARLDVAGQTRTQSLQITGGADFAENFEVNAAPAGAEVVAQKIEPGMVVSIDPTSPGKLALSAQAYDRRVAGVISGAGGVKPGMVMSQEGTLADGEYPVALSGRVYCWVDASQGSIEPGDLLTTSNSSGHAMKATDAAKAQGAIIGKAMTGLKEGKGLVLALVNLQ